MFRFTDEMIYVHYQLNINTTNVTVRVKYYWYKYAFVVRHQNRHKHTKRIINISASRIVRCEWVNDCCQRMMTSIMYLTSIEDNAERYTNNARHCIAMLHQLPL